MPKKRFELYPYKGKDVPGKDKTLANIRDRRYPDWAIQVSEIDTSRPGTPFYNAAENDPKHDAYLRYRHEVFYGGLTEVEAQEYEALCQLGPVPLTGSEVEECRNLFEEQRACQAKGEHLPDECPECHKEFPRNAFQIFDKPRTCDKCKCQGEDGSLHPAVLVHRKQARLNELSAQPSEAMHARRSMLGKMTPDPEKVAPLKAQAFLLLERYCKDKGYIS